MFMRVGGGIYTKGEIEQGILEDDPRDAHIVHSGTARNGPPIGRYTRHNGG
jgi:Na+/H+-translocating membrane pyrophosphatase